MIAYLTLGEKYSGIFSGQVVDVCYLLSEQTGENVALICFISLRNFKKEKIKIKNAYQNLLNSISNLLKNKSGNRTKIKEKSYYQECYS